MHILKDECAHARIPRPCPPARTHTTDPAARQRSGDQGTEQRARGRDFIVRRCRGQAHAGTAGGLQMMGGLQAWLGQDGRVGHTRAHKDTCAGTHAFMHTLAGVHSYACTYYTHTQTRAHTYTHIHTNGNVQAENYIKKLKLDKEKARNDVEQVRMCVCCFMCVFVQQVVGWPTPPRAWPSTPPIPLA